MDTGAKGRELKGRHVAAMFLAGFGAIIAANATLAVQAMRSFPGLEVRNSYVASQSFDAERRAQAALGWTAYVTLKAGRLTVVFADAAGRPVQPATAALTIGRTTQAAEDEAPPLVWTGSGYAAEVAGGPGRWVVHLTATAADGTSWRQRITLSDEAAR
jgi:nitrogen fixation protein FixH